MNKILFALLLCSIPGFAMAQATPAATDEGAAGVEGTISISPVQGGPTRQGAPDSRPLAKITFEVKQEGRAIQSFETDDQGRFRVELRPGHYTIARKDWSSAIGFYGPFEVEVAKGKMMTVDWKCDTGIR